MFSLVWCFGIGLFGLFGLDFDLSLGFGSWRKAGRQCFSMCSFVCLFGKMFWRGGEMVFCKVVEGLFDIFVAFRDPERRSFPKMPGLPSAPQVCFLLEIFQVYKTPLKSMVFRALAALADSKDKRSRKRSQIQSRAG